MQRYDSPPALQLPPTPTYPTPAMSVTTSEDSLLGDNDFLDDASLPFASHTKTSGKRKRTLFASATLVSLLFLASYFTIQHRAADQFTGDIEPFPFNPEDLELPPNATYPIGSRYSGVRGPPTPHFRGACLPAIVNGIFDLPNLDNLLPDKQYLTSWPSAGWSESYCCLLPFVLCSPSCFPYVPQQTM